MGAKANILLISYYFPPLGMGGVGRPLALYRYLPQFGYQVYVLTVKDIVYPHYDPSLLDQVDVSRVYRSGSYDPARLLYLLGKRKMSSSGFGAGASRRFFPDSKKGWVGPAVRAAKHIIKSEHIRAVITTSPPPSVHGIGRKLKERYDLPWVADFRDVWFSRPIEMLYNSEKKRKRALALRDDIVTQADNVVVVNGCIKDYLGRGEVIYNAADDALVPLWRSEQRDEESVFVIGVLGTINELCPLEPLLKAVAALDKAVAKRIRIRHVGHGDADSMRALAARYGLEENLELRGYQVRQTAIEKLADAELLYLGVREQGRYHIVPGRLFDCLISGKKILGMIADGSDAARLIEKTGRGRVVAPDDTGGAAEYIGHCLADTGGEHDEPAADVREFLASSLAGKYAGVLDRVLEISD